MDVKGYPIAPRCCFTGEVGQVDIPRKSEEFFTFVADDRAYEPGYHVKKLYNISHPFPCIEEKFRQALKTIGKSYNIKATTPIVCKMIDLVNGDSEPVDNWHYLSDIFGPKVPAEVGAMLALFVSHYR